MKAYPTLDAVIISPKTRAKTCIIWLHGLGADGHDFVDIIPQLKLPEQLATRYIFPHASIRSVTLNGGVPMRAWFDAYGLTIDSKQDTTGIKNAGQLIAGLIRQEIDQGIPADKILVAGFSQGGALALYAGLHFPEKLAGILALSTYIPIAESWQPAQLQANHSTPIFMAHGIADPILQLQIGEFSKNHLLSMGYHVDWHTYPMGHSVCPQEIQDIAHWLAKVLG